MRHFIEHKTGIRNHPTGGVSTDQRSFHIRVGAEPECRREAMIHPPFTKRPSSRRRLEQRRKAEPVEGEVLFQHCLEKHERVAWVVRAGELPEDLVREAPRRRGVGGDEGE